MIGDPGPELKRQIAHARGAARSFPARSAMANHRIHVSDLALHAGHPTVRVTGDEAHHAVRVKRLESGDPVTLLDGRGRMLSGPITSIDKDRQTGEWTLTIDGGGGVQLQPRPTHPVLVFAPAPKGDRLAEMIDGLSQVGASAWHHLQTERTVTDPRPTKVDRLERIAFEAMKQCGRAWMLELGESCELARIPLGPATIVADDTGGSLSDLPLPAEGPVRLLVGPEGGFSPDELERLRRGGCGIARLGPHILRIETAAIVGAARVHAAREGQSAPSAGTTSGSKLS